MPPGTVDLAQIRAPTGERQEFFSGIRMMSRMLLSPDGSLVFSVGHEVWIVAAGLGSLAESPWPCGGGNLQNNPVWV
jgi:hypothetical protein